MKHFILIEGVGTVEEALDVLASADLSTLSIEERVDIGLAVEKLPHKGKFPSKQGATEIIGPVVFSSYSQYKRARTVVLAARRLVRDPGVVQVAKASLDAMNWGTITVSGAYDQVKAAEKERYSPSAPAETEGLPKTPLPMGSARGSKARALRIEWIKALAAKGATSDEIARRLEIGLDGVRRLSKSINLTVQADVALQKTQRKAHDPNRAMTMAVTDLDALSWSLQRIDPNSLDPDQVDMWAEQLQEYARSIARVARQMKTKE